MCVAQQVSTWGNKLDLAAVANHSASALFMAHVSCAIVVDTVVVSTQRGQVRRISLPTILMRVDVVDLASVCRYFAVRPRADEIFCHGQDSLLA